jgi:hypothetical protein
MSPFIHKIRVKGHLSDDWASEFEGMNLTCEPDGCTAFTGALPDQAALFGFLIKLRDLGLDLIDVHQYMDGETVFPHHMSEGEVKGVMGNEEGMAK